MNFIPTIFEEGGRYRSICAFSSGPVSAFDTGEVLVFERGTYSFYDNAFVYLFHDEATGVAKEWWLFESEPTEMWRQYFEPVGPDRK